MTFKVQVAVGLALTLGIGLGAAAARHSERQKEWRRNGRVLQRVGPEDLAMGHRDVTLWAGGHRVRAIERWPAHLVHLEGGCVLLERDPVRWGARLEELDLTPGRYPYIFCGTVAVEPSVLEW